MEQDWAILTPHMPPCTNVAMSHACACSNFDYGIGELHLNQSLHQFTSYIYISNDKWQIVWVLGPGFCKMSSGLGRRSGFLHQNQASRATKSQCKLACLWDKMNSKNASDCVRKCNGLRISRHLIWNLKSCSASAQPVLAGMWSMLPASPERH